MENYKWDMGTNAMVPQWMHVANQGCLLSHANLIPSILKERQVAKIFSWSSRFREGSVHPTLLPTWFIPSTSVLLEDWREAINRWLYQLAQLRNPKHLRNALWWYLINVCCFICSCCHHENKSAVQMRLKFKKCSRKSLTWWSKRALFEFAPDCAYLRPFALICARSCALIFVRILMNFQQVAPKSEICSFFKWFTS